MARITDLLVPLPVNIKSTQETALACKVLNICKTLTSGITPSQMTNETFIDPSTVFSTVGCVWDVERNIPAQFSRP